MCIAERGLTILILSFQTETRFELTYVISILCIIPRHPTHYTLLTLFILVVEQIQTMDNSPTYVQRHTVPQMYADVTALYSTITMKT